MSIIAASHVHSEWSYDAKWTLEQLASAFERRGYGVVMMTEHDLGFTEERRQAHRRACAEASSESLLVVPGIEYSDADNLVHVLVWGDVPFLGEGVPTSDLLKLVEDSNGVAVLAHPSRKEAWKRYDLNWSNRLLGIETWNRKTDGWSPSKSAPAILEGTSLVHFAGLDFHDQRQFFPLGMKFEFAVPVTQETVVEALRERRCRAWFAGGAMKDRMRPPVTFALRRAEYVRRHLAALRRRYRGGSRKTG